LGQSVEFQPIWIFYYRSLRRDKPTRVRTTNGGGSLIRLPFQSPQPMKENTDEIHD
jgi:hypothetical protein